MNSPDVETPDYAAANREAVYADMETLPDRKKIEAAARLGQKITYTDPQTGQTRTADFTGVGDNVYAQQAADLAVDTNNRMQRGQLDLRQELVKDPVTGEMVTRGEETALQTTREVQAADPQAYQARQDLTKKVMDDLGSPASDIKADTTLGEMAKRVAATQVPGQDARYGQLYNAGAQVTNNAAARSGEIDQLTQVQQRGTDPSLMAYAMEANRLTQQDPTTRVLNQSLQKAAADYQQGGKLTDAQRSEVEQQVRAGQSARGNVLGNSAALVEAMEVGKAADAREAQRLQTLTDLQGKAFAQNQQSNQSRLAALGDVQSRVTSGNQYNDTARRADIDQRYNLLSGADQQQVQNLGALSGLVSADVAQGQQAYANQMNNLTTAANLTAQQTAENRATRSENYGRDQQKLSNASSFVLGQPITNQFGALGAAQQGTVGFNQVGYQGGNNAANASTGQVYQMQGDMWNTAQNIKAQNQQSMMSLASGVAGSAAGAMMM